MSTVEQREDYYTQCLTEHDGLEIYMAQDTKLHPDAKITVKGHGNKMYLEEGASLGQLSAPRLEFLGNNNIFHIGKKANIKRGHYRFDGNDGRIDIGEKTTIGNAYFLCAENTTIQLGTDCMLSYEVEFRTTDAHSLIDEASGEVINYPADIIVGDHVWIGKGGCLLQGIEIASNCIVGTRALVTKSFLQEKTAIAGVPAKVVRENVLWDRKPPKQPK